MHLSVDLCVEGAGYRGPISATSVGVGYKMPFVTKVTNY